MIHRVRLTVVEVQNAVALYLIRGKNLQCNAEEVTFWTKAESTGDPYEPSRTVFDGAEAIVTTREGT